MPSSIYDILENRKIRLEQAEILDLAADVSHGLEYLHGHRWRRVRSGGCGAALMT